MEGRCHECKVCRADRCLWAGDHLPPRVGDRPLRFPLCLLHGGGMTFLPKKDVLSLEELDRLCSAFVAEGVRKLRLTGGEPLVRKNIMALVRSLSRHLASGHLDELTLTTNGSQLARFAPELAGFGVKRINVSVDTHPCSGWTRQESIARSFQCTGRGH
jgi:molybdenum cofactor biosynthesis enzyme MoaA